MSQALGPSWRQSCVPLALWGEPLDSEARAYTAQRKRRRSRGHVGSNAKQGNGACHWVALACALGMYRVTLPRGVARKVIAQERSQRDRKEG